MANKRLARSTSGKDKSQPHDGRMSCRMESAPSQLHPTRAVKFRKWLRSLTGRRHVAPMLLVAICLVSYLPGVVRLPAVDRTEIVFALTSGEMVKSGDWLDPRYGGVAQPFHPVGTNWAQGVAALLAGPSNERIIALYRLPSLLAVALAVLAVYWLMAPIIGSEAALLSAALFAAAPLTVLVSQLAVADGLALFPATVAMLSLLCIYVASGTPRNRWLPLLFWASLGAGMLVNALQAPLIVLTTILGLFIVDRDLAWLRRSSLFAGAPLALLIAAPWLVVRAHQDGIPFQGLAARDIISALAGAQNMKLTAYPGSFLLAAALGFMPGTVLLPAALQRLWRQRASRLPRFLIVWIVSYLCYLETFSFKPATYMVQLMFPAAAIATALVITSSEAAGTGTSRLGSLSKWLAASVALIFFGLVYRLSGELPTPLAAVMIAGTTILLVQAARHREAGDYRSWAAYAVASLMMFAVTTFGLVLPTLRTIWPAREIGRLASLCSPGEIALFGFREPSAQFVLGVDRATPSMSSVSTAPDALHVVESRWLDRYRSVMADRGARPTELACIEAHNMTRGCRLGFTLMAFDPVARGCAPSAAMSCNNIRTRVRTRTLGDCD